MKHFTLLFLFVIGACSVLKADIVNSEMAAKVAKNHYWNNSEKTFTYEELQVQLVYTKTFENAAVYYVFEINENDGFVIIAADNDVYPVLGYSFKGIYTDIMDNLPPDFIWWMQNYTDQIVYVRDNGINATENISNIWDGLLIKKSNQTSPKNVNPLLTTTWNQDIYYNAECPEDASGPGGHVYVGCVATAMGQVMKYHNHPQQGTGSHTYYCSPYGSLTADFGATTYNWSSMPNSLYNHNIAVATLLFHLGVSVDMDYGPNGSGAYSSDARDALVNYFNYSSDAQMIWKDDYSSTDWQDIIKADLEASRPVYYNGQGPDGGHAFVCDGYQGTNYFHFNWGWSGYANGYFYLTNLNPAGMNFTENQGAIVHVFPESTIPSDPPENVTADVVLPNNVHVEWDPPSGGGQTGYTDDFESYDDFVIEFSPWTCVDVDGSTTYGMTGTEWPNAYDPQAFIIFNPTTTEPPVADMTAHSGDKFAACLAATTPDNDDWLISPQILIESGDMLSFWVKTYVDTYGLERYKVGVSTTGTDPADFTIVSGAGYLEAPVADWEEYTYDLSSYVGDDVYIGIQCVSSDAFVFMVDDFSVGSTKANIDFNTNTAITGTAVKDTDANAVPGKPNTVYGGLSSVKTTLEGYNIFRDGDEIGYVDIPTTEYDDLGLSPGTYEYCVTAVYDDGESIEVCADEVNVIQTEPLAPPSNLETNIDVNDIVLTWDPPGGVWMQWDLGTNNGNGIGLNGGGTFSVASHWDVASLADYIGLTITQIQFFPNSDPNATFTIKVWTGANGNNEVLSQDVPSFNVDEWNIVDLSTPIPIDGNQDFWFGYEVTHGEDMFPAGCDDGPAIAGYGDMIYMNGSWSSLFGLNPDLNYNWNIAGYVEAVDGTTKLLGKEVTPATTSSTLVASGSTGVSNTMDKGGKSFEGYNIYYSMNGAPYQLEGTTDETTYTHTDAATIPALHCYEVTAVYDPEGESDATDESCELTGTFAIPEFLLDATRVYPNPASDVVNITSYFEINNVKVYNFAGQIVADEAISNTLYQLNTSEFKSGLYLFQIETSEGTISKRIVIE